MNQILYVLKKNKTIIYRYKLVLVISLISILVLLLYLIYQKSNDKKMSTVMTKSYDISKLYDSQGKSPAINYELESRVVPFIMGTLEIPSLNTSFPVISETTDELLKISVCRFFGPKHITARQYLYCWSQL